MENTEGWKDLVRDLKELIYKDYKEIEWKKPKETPPEW